MKIIAVCLGRAEKLVGKSYKTGINKTAIHGPVLVDAEGLVGDAICNRKHHGGIDQAVYIEGSKSLEWWAEALGAPVEPGTFGENLVIDGLDNREVAIGDRFIVGEVVMEATAARIPCATFAARMEDQTFARRYTKAARPGFYCRVLASGILERAQPVHHQPYAGERITMPEMMEAFGRRFEGTELSRHLSTPLSSRLRTFLTA